MEEEKEKKLTKEGLLEESKRLLEELRQTNEQTKELLEKRDKQLAEDLISGKSQAGSVPEAPKEETPQEYAKRVMSGKI